MPHCKNYNHCKIGQISPRSKGHVNSSLKIKENIEIDDSCKI